MRRAQAVLLGVTTAAVALSCTDRRSGGPTGSARTSIAAGCPTAADLNPVAERVFGGRNADWTTLTGMVADVAQRYVDGKTAEAKKEALDAVSFIKGRQAAGVLKGTQADVDQLINGILCVASLTTADAAAVFVVPPSTTTQTVVSTDGQVGAVVPPNSLTEPTVITVAPIPGTFTNGGGPLTTKLDQYSGFYEFHSQTVSGAPLTHPIVVAVCPSASLAAAVRARLRLGHQASSGFEVTPKADGSFLPCTGGTASTSRMPAWLREFVNLVRPKPLYAHMQLEERSGGVGGAATEFSPFAPVDIELRASGGVGGTATEFTISPPNGHANSVDGSGVCTSVDALPGGPVERACRPGVIIATHLGTVLQNVPVSWTVTSGGGLIAPEASGSRACGAFGTTATTTTDASGRVGICWTVGPDLVPNTVTATVSAGGDAPAGVTFTQSTFTFTATVVRAQPAVTAVGANVVFDGLPHPGSGTCSDGLTPALTYSDGAVPVNAGTYTLTVTCGAGTTNFATAVQTATIVITPALPTVAIECPATVVYNGSERQPCTATATGLGGAALSNATVSYVAPVPVNVGTYTATANVAAAGNYGAGSASKSFEITHAPTVTTVTCPASAVTYTGSPLTPCSATVTGPGGLSQAVTTLAYSANVGAGTATASATWGGGPNHLASSGSATFPIAAASAVVTVTCDPASVVYTGAAQTPCTATATGPGGLHESLTPVYGSNTNAGTATAAASYAGNANVGPATGSATFTISPAPSATAVTCPASVAYSGSPATPCSAVVSGAGGLGAAVTPAYSGNVNAGTATAAATYAGDANHAGSTGSKSFTITPATSLTTVSCPATVTYNGAAQSPCAATTTGANLSQPVAVTYAPAAVRSVGPYSATATYDGDANHAASTGSGAFSVTALAATATAGSGTRALGAPNPTLPCVVSGLLAVDAGSVACTTTIPATPTAGTYATTVSLTATNANYSVTTIPGTLTVTAPLFVQSGCFASPIASALPPTSAGLSKGASVLVKCRLLDATGRPVVTATGSLVVQDRGTTGAASPTTAFSGTNVFAVSDDHDFSADDGFYTYSLSTSPAAFVKGHYYLVTATWSDGSTTAGWFYLKP